MKDVVNQIMDYESGSMSDDEQIEFFQQLVNTGMINGLQGHYQRVARDMFEMGLISDNNKRKS
jgi:hypothetical protein